MARSPIGTVNVINLRIVLILQSRAICYIRARNKCMQYACMQYTRTYIFKNIYIYMYKYILETQPVFSFYEYSHSTHICVLILAETSDIIPFSMSHLFTIILVCVILHAHLSYLSHKCGEYPIISFIQWFYRLASGRTVISTINYIRSNLFMCSKVDCRNSLVI